MSQEAADRFFMFTIAWESQPDPKTVSWKPEPKPDWYKQLNEKGCTTEELIRAAAENGYGEFTEEEYNESRSKSQHLMRQVLG